MGLGIVVVMRIFTNVRAHDNTTTYVLCILTMRILSNVRAHGNTATCLLRIFMMRIFTNVYFAPAIVRS